MNTNDLWDLPSIEVKTVTIEPVRLDSVTPRYYAHRIAATERVETNMLDELSELEVTRVRTEFKNLTFASRAMGRESDNQLLVELTEYMSRRFPKRGSTSPCTSVTV